jgi:hypothetical protein
MITASVSTFVATSFVALLNLHGDLYKISAAGSSTFLALTWLAVGLCLLRNLPFLAILRICLSTDSRLVTHSDAIRLLDSVD